MNQPTVDELNEAQREWMALDSNAPDKEKKRVFALMGKYPRCYVSGHDGKGVVIMDGGPLCRTITFPEALELCRKHGGRIDVAWNGTLGRWYQL